MFTVPLLILLVVAMIAIVAFIVFVERSERRIPVQYAKRIVGRRLMGGQSTHLPLKVNSGGVMPIIFAASVLSAPMLFGQAAFVKNSAWLSRTFDALRAGEPAYELLYMIAIVFFAYFYISIVFRPDDIADNMRKYGGFIPGHPAGAAYFGLCQRDSDPDHAGGRDLPDCCGDHSAADDQRYSPEPSLADRGWFESLPPWVTNGLGFNFYFGGTSLLIVVGVAMDTVNQVESQLIMRHYEGFSPKSGRIRGRRAW